MADDKSKVGHRDRLRISLAEDYEVRDWCRKFGCTPTELVAAVKAVGNGAKAVEAYLQSRDKATQ